MKATRQWYLLITAGNQEKAVAKRLRAKGIEVFLPVQTVLRQWSDRLRPVTIPVFPARLFARFGEAPELGMYVFNTPGLHSAFGGRNRVPIPDSEIETLRRTLDLGFSCAAVPMPNSGEHATIVIEPPIEGILIDAGDPSRVAVPFPSFGEALVVEVPPGRLRLRK